MARHASAAAAGRFDMAESASPGGVHGRNGTRLQADFSFLVKNPQVKNGAQMGKNLLESRLSTDKTKGLDS